MQQGGSRREALASVLAGSLLLGGACQAKEELAPGRTKLSVSNLNSFQRNAERAAFLKLVEAELRQGLKPEDAEDTLRLVLHDAGTFDVATGTGGINGSIVLDEELNRPENKSLKPIVDKLKGIKGKLDERTQKGGYGTISWADLEVLAAKVANEAAWGVVKRSRGVPSAGDIISTAFGATWNVKLGRVDSGKPDPEGRLPKPDASVAEITEFFGRLNNRDFGATGFFAPKPFFDQRQAFILYGSAQPGGEAKLTAEPGFQYQEIKKKYDRSRATVTRTDFEVDTIDYFTALAGLGAKFDPDAYLLPIEIDTPKF